MHGEILRSRKLSCCTLLLGFLSGVLISYVLPTTSPSIAICLSLHIQPSPADRQPFVADHDHGDDEDEVVDDSPYDPILQKDGIFVDCDHDSDKVDDENPPYDRCLPKTQSSTEPSLGLGTGHGQPPLCSSALEREIFLGGLQ